jgi:hypothetical protein
MVMPTARRVATIAALIGSVSLFGCASKDQPTVREVVIVSDTQLEVSVWCASKPQPYVLITETATQVRLRNQYAAPNKDCETGETLTLQSPLGTRTIVDERDGHTIPVQLDYRCGDPQETVGRCDGIDTPAPPPFGG